MAVSAADEDGAPGVPVPALEIPALPGWTVGTGQESDATATALTASASGLDPHISPKYARLQVERIADARDLPVADVEALVEEHTQGRDLGYLGEPTVNVLELNTALAETGR